MEPTTWARYLRRVAKVTPMTSEKKPASPWSIDWLTADEAAAYLKMKGKTFLRQVRLGKINGYCLSGTKRHVWRFRREDLDAALLSHPVLTSETPTVLSTERRIA
jgi:excisionase family DNA binding protein